MSTDLESFSYDEKKKLSPYVTNIDSPIFALQNLPEVVKGALFSRYSRSNLGLKKLLLKEFINSEYFDTSETPTQEQAIKKAEAFYDRVLDGFGDDSIGELGGAHLALENVSIVASKIIEDARIGGSPLEKSTRYIFFDQKVNGDYRFLKEPVLMNSCFKDLYLSVCRSLFDTYSEMIPGLTEHIVRKYPKDTGIPDTVYQSTVRAKVCDALRGVLPASTLTNVGIFGNGRFFEKFLQTTSSSELQELQEIGKKAYKELSKIIPSFVRRGNPEHHHHQAWKAFMVKQNSFLKRFSDSYNGKKENISSLVSLIEYDPDAEYKVIAALLYPHRQESLQGTRETLKQLSQDEISKIFVTLAGFRENRRHKPPRALEHAYYTFDLVGDFGMFRDMHRHRILTQERQILTTDYGYEIPIDVTEAGMDDLFKNAMATANEAFEKISPDFPLQAQYVVPMAYKIRWYFRLNLRSLIWITELRSAPQGHTNYRIMAQDMAKAVMQAHPLFAPLFKFVDFNNYDLGRLKQEIKSENKKTKFFEES